MKNLLKPAIGGAIFMLAALVPTVIHADEWDKKTYLTFSGPVQVPGMTLPAGKYTFKLLNSTSDRFVVQVFNEKESHLYTTLLAIPNLHLKTPEKTVVSFYEAPSGQAEPIKAWFYPGDNYGRQFVYPKSEAALISQAAHESVPSDATFGTAASAAPVTAQTDTSNAQVTQPVTTDSTVTTDQSTKSRATDQNQQPVEPEIQPVTNEVAATPATPELAATVDATPAVAEPTADQTPSNDNAAPATDNSALPATASSLPLVAFLGLLSILGAVTLRFASRLS